MARHPRTNTHEVARAGQQSVVRELHRRGASVVTPAHSDSRNEVFASDSKRLRTVAIRVKTKSGKWNNWQTKITDGRPRDLDPGESRFWVFVDLKRQGETPDYFIVPEWWMQNDIHTAHRAFLDSHGGERPVTPGSTHHSINMGRIEQWRDRWDLLGILPEQATSA